MSKRKKPHDDDVSTSIPRPMLNGQPFANFEGEITSDIINTFL